MLIITYRGVIIGKKKKVSVKAYFCWIITTFVQDGIFANLRPDI